MFHVGKLPSTGGTRREDREDRPTEAAPAAKRLGPSRLRIVITAAIIIVVIVIAAAIIVDIYGEGLPSTGGERIESMMGGNMTEGNDTGENITGDNDTVGNMNSGLGGNFTGGNLTWEPGSLELPTTTELPSTGGERLGSAN